MRDRVVGGRKRLPGLSIYNWARSCGENLRLDLARPRISSTVMEQTGK